MTMNVHFIGIGGIHMSALAHILLDDGLAVSGCDRADAPILQPLHERGARITIGHNDRHVVTATQVIRTAAVPESHPEVARAIELGIPVQTRAELLAQIAAPRQVIAVGGTHGKTTTSAMIAHAMRASGRDCGYVIGGELPDFHVHARRGTDPWLVLEADEYGRAFHHYQPTIAILTNCEPDHLDYYGSRDALEEAFLQFVLTLKPNGTLIVSQDSALATEIAHQLHAQRPDVRITATSTREPATYRIIPRGSAFEIATPKARHCGVLRQPGEHQLQNAAATLAALDTAGFDLPRSLAALATFSGVERRFQLHGEAADVVLLDDYAHHPSEIAATIAAARQRWPERRVVVLFQPHTYTRTAYLLDGFRACFAEADAVYIADTYAARDMSGNAMTSAQLAQEIIAPTAIYAGSVEQSGHRTAADAQPGDLIITMGAGDIDAAGPLILSELRRKT